MTEINDGGPAFPRTGHTDGITTTEHEGMSLRDYWAGQVVNGELAGLPPDGTISPEALAKWGFRVADAMLAARRAN